MSRRLELHSELEKLLGSKNVYFQPPESFKLHYPCFRYNVDTGDTQYANDMPYIFQRRYQLMYITKDPDDELVDKIAMAFPTIRFDRTYTSDNLNHYVYNLYY